MNQKTDIQDIVSRMKTLGERLVPYNFPMAPPHVEEDINPSKTVEATVDGYQLVLYYSKADYKNYIVEMFQVFGKNDPFLPFNLVTKLAKTFLGKEGLSLTEVIRDNRKIYCWTLRTDNVGQLIHGQLADEVEECEYEGMRYVYLRPDQVNIY